MGFRICTKAQLRGAPVVTAAGLQREVVESQGEKSHSGTQVATATVVGVRAGMSPSFSGCIFQTWTVQFSQNPRFVGEESSGGRAQRNEFEFHRKLAKSGPVSRLRAGANTFSRLSRYLKCNEKG